MNSFSINIENALSVLVMRSRFDEIREKLIVEAVDNTPLGPPDGDDEALHLSDLTDRDDAAAIAAKKIYNAMIKRGYSRVTTIEDYREDAEFYSKKAKFGDHYEIELRIEVDKADENGFHEVFGMLTISPTDSSDPNEIVYIESDGKPVFSKKMKGVNSIIDKVEQAAVRFVIESLLNLATYNNVRSAIDSAD